MVGLDSAPPWLETDWILGQFGEERDRAQRQYAAFVNAGIGKESVWEDLRHQIFLSSDEFVERFAGTKQKPEELREVPRAQRRALAKPLVTYELMSAEFGQF